jgi:hypothetical protein
MVIRLGEAFGLIEEEKATRRAERRAVAVVVEARRAELEAEASAWRSALGVVKRVKVK